MRIKSAGKKTVSLYFARSKFLTWWIILIHGFSGAGSFARMKNAMIQHVVMSRYDMFREATNSVRDKLNGICDEMEHALLASISTIMTEMSSEYSRVIIGTDLARVSQIARDEILEVLSESDELFRIQSFNEDRMIDVDDQDEGLRQASM
jgi:hypothetical protein